MHTILLNVAGMAIVLVSVFTGCVEKKACECMNSKSPSIKTVYNSEMAACCKHVYSCIYMNKNSRKSLTLSTNEELPSGFVNYQVLQEQISGRAYFSLPFVVNNRLYWDSSNQPKIKVELIGDNNTVLATAFYSRAAAINKEFPDNWDGNEFLLIYTFKDTPFSDFRKGENLRVSFKIDADGSGKESAYSMTISLTDKGTTTPYCSQKKLWIKLTGGI